MEIKNDVVICPNGHYYNAAVHSVCPTCGRKGVSSNAGNFPPTENPGAASGAGVSPAGSFPRTEGPGMSAAPQGNFPPTQDPRGLSAASGPMGVTAAADTWNADGGAVNPFSQPTIIGGDIASAGQVDPVVGWLVCIDGPVRGTDWRIHAGYNYIGRETGDIHIQGDNQISREKHAMVAYHARNHTYYVGPAEGRNIIEVNDEPVFNATKLNSYDVITVGTTKLLFIGLCGDRFSWDRSENV